MTASGITTAPASFGQERLWFLDQLGQGALYNVTELVAVPPDVRSESVSRWLQVLQGRHEALRTSLTRVGGDLVQVIHRDPPSIELEVVEGCDRTGRDGIWSAVTDASSRRFDLGRVPLARAVLIGAGTDDALLALIVHHVVGDGWSLEVLTKEIESMYLGHRLADAPQQFRSIATAERQRDRDGGFADGLNYWRDSLDGVAALGLATRPRPAALSGRGTLGRARLDSDVIEGMRELARRERASLFMVGLALVASLIARFGGSRDVAIGSPVSMRDDGGRASIVGLLANTVALRVDVSDDPTFVEAVRRARATVLGALVHRAVPFERVVEVVNPPRSAGANPIFQVAFSLEDLASSTSTTNGAFRRADVEQRPAAKFDLSVALKISADGDAEVQVISSDDVIEPEAAQQLASSFGILLTSALRDAGSRVHDLDVLADDGRKQCPASDGVAQANDEEVTVHELVTHALTNCSADHIVVGGDTRDLCANDVIQLSDAVARELSARGVRAGDVVGVCMERSERVPAFWLGVLKVGAAFLPLDPRHPTERLSYMLSDAGATALIYESVCPNGADVVVDAHKIVMDPRSTAALAPTTSASDMAYVIYTSGSTGRPKGVAVSHRALVSVLCAARVHLVTTEESAWHATASFSFDISVFEIFMCLTSGARVDIASGPWAEVREDVTHIQATPSHLRGLLKSGNLGRSGTRRTVLAGGEQLPLDLVSQLMERAAVRVLNLYGPAEATIWASIFDVSGLTDRRVPIGRPLSNTSLYVMDDKCSRVAAGVSGEICIGGHGVAWGYLGNAMQTADRFVPDPFSDRPGARMYRTGDNGRFRSDGVLEFLGRSDGQVKVDGQRIELGEVENALNEHPDVSASAAAVREVQPGDRRLVAFVTTHSGVDESAGAMLRAFLSGLLPQGLIPSTIHVVPELPLNVNGKIDRAALLSLPTGDPQRVAGRMPEGEIERAVARIWSEVLGTDAVPADCNFFDLGGTSLRLAEVFARLDETFPGRLTLLDLFASTTVGEVAAHLGSSHESAIPEVFVV